MTTSFHMFGACKHELKEDSKSNFINKKVVLVLSAGEEASFNASHATYDQSTLSVKR
jgi:hypothetical protein